MTFDDRMDRLNSLMAGNAEAYEMARKLDKLPPGKRQRRLEVAPKSPEYLSYTDMDRIARHYEGGHYEVEPEMSGLKKIVESGSFTIDPKAERAFWSDRPMPDYWEATKEVAKPTPETHRYRYPVRKPRRTLSLHHRDGGTLPPPETSFADQELRYRDGDSNVEVWEGDKMVARIPVHALQSVLMNELLEAVGYYE